MYEDCRFHKADCTVNGRLARLLSRDIPNDQFKCMVVYENNGIDFVPQGKLRFL